MSGGGTAAIVVLAVIAVVGLGWLSYHQAKKRREQFAAFAASQGWTYVPSDQSLTGQWEGEPFGQGDHRRAINVVTGPFQGRPIVAFDYSYQTHSTTSNGRRTTTTHKYGVVAMRMPGALPWLQVEHEGIFGGAVANALGFRDIQFESEQFNRTFRVKAADDRFGHAVVHPRMMEMLLARGEIGWRFAGDTVLGWSRGSHDPNQLMWRLDLLMQVIGQVPAYVWRDYAGVDPRH
jgi:hypothetical protein